MILKWLVGVTSGEGFLVYLLVFVAQHNVLHVLLLLPAAKSHLYSGFC